MGVKYGRGDWLRNSATFPDLLDPTLEMSNSSDKSGFPEDEKAPSWTLKYGTQLVEVTIPG